MIVLGLDTATRSTAVALWDTHSASASSAADAALIERRDDPPPGARPGHAAQLLALAVEALAAAEIGWDQVDRIAVGTGPGTFTGLRIGIATARALAQARGIPLVGVSSLQSLALVAAPAARALGATHVGGVIDARRGELFAASWPVDAVADPAAAPTLVPFPYRPPALAEALALPSGSTLLVGDGANAARELLTGAGACLPAEDSALHLVSGIGHCRLGAALPDPGGALGDVAPAYLRVPDAELTRRAAEEAASR